jgi:hypothetical protein
MSRVGPHRDGLYEALPGHILRSRGADVRALVGAGARDQILAVADELSVPVHAVCYECRLRRDDGRVDLAVCLLPMRTVGIDGVLGRLGRDHLAAPPWRRCLALLAAWSDPSSELAAQVPFACVAFDLPVDRAVERAAVPVPGLSLCIDREFFTRQRGLPTGLPAPVSALRTLAADCHRRLCSEAPPPASLALLERCLSSDDVIAKHVSFMLSRTPMAVKLDVRVPIGGLAALLRRIEWPGPADGVVARVRALASRQRHVQLNLVLAPGLDENLEVELLTSAAEAGDDERTAVLKNLVDEGHCDPAKVAVLLRNSQHPVYRDPEGQIVARNWYLKAKLRGDRIAEVKAYLGLLPRAWAPRGVGATHEVRLGDTA